MRSPSWCFFLAVFILGISCSQIQSESLSSSDGESELVNIMEDLNILSNYNDNDDEEIRPFTWTTHFYGCLELFLSERKVRPLTFDIGMLLVEWLEISISKSESIYDEVLRTIGQGIGTIAQNYNGIRLQNQMLKCISATYNPLPPPPLYNSGFRSLVNRPQRNFIMVFVQKRLGIVKEFLQVAMKPNLNRRGFIKMALKYQHIHVINYFLFAFIHESSHWLFTLSYLDTRSITRLCNRHQNNLRPMIRGITEALEKVLHFRVSINWEDDYQGRKLFITRSLLRAAYIFLKFIKITTNDPNSIKFQGQQQKELRREFSEGLNSMWRMINAAFDEDFYQVEVIQNVLFNIP